MDSMKGEPFSVQATPLAAGSSLPVRGRQKPKHVKTLLRPPLAVKPPPEETERPASTSPRATVTMPGTWATLMEAYHQEKAAVEVALPGRRGFYTGTTTIYVLTVAVVAATGGMLFGFDVVGWRVERSPAAGGDGPGARGPACARIQPGIRCGVAAHAAMRLPCRAIQPPASESAHAPHLPFFLSSPRLPACLRQGIVGGVEAMVSFQKMFFPEIYEHTTRQHQGGDPYCIYADHRLQLYSASMFLSGAVCALPAGYITRALGRKVSEGGPPGCARIHARIHAAQG